MNRPHQIGVIGAGVIGIGVAQDFAQAGYPVILIDLVDEILQQARANIGQNVRLYRFYDTRPPNSPRDNNPESVLARITFTTDYGLLQDVSYVVENVTERWPVKEAVHRKLDAVCPPEAIFAVNSSCIPITKVASVTRRPDRVIGAHFMNPVPVKDTVEVIRGYHTSEETITRTRDLLTALDKKMILINDAPGFVSNRVMMLTVNEAAFLVQEGVASASDVDQIFKSCYSHRMGPLETADLIGLDTILHSIEGLYELFCDSKFRPCPLLRQMVDAGLLGRKSGRGFYVYENQPSSQPVR
ncbi:MAG: 3-hydroxyacyl-CoA dehydrogenase family protein [Chloroflexota bacterium]